MGKAGSAMICIMFTSAILALFWAIIMIIGISAVFDNAGPFWGLFAFQFFLGLLQGWFLMDIITMGLEFRREWKSAHPEDPPEDYVPPTPKEREKKDETTAAIIEILLWCCCCPFYCCYVQCCKPKEEDPDKDPYDHGQDDFGVNYLEYMAWKAGEEVGDRELPMEYQLDFTEMMAKAEALKNQATEKGKEAMDKGKKMALKLKEKASKKKVMENDENEEEVELVVDGGNTQETTKENKGNLKPLGLKDSMKMQMGMHQNLKPQIVPTDDEQSDYEKVEKEESPKNEVVWNWLDQIGLSQYYDTVINEGYESLTDLQSITEKDLDGMGINKQMHKKKILKKIEEETGKEQDAEKE